MLRKVLFGLASMLVIAGSPLRAQEREEYWSGILALTPSVSLRIGVGISRQGQEVVEAVMDSPDQHAFDIPLDNLALNEERLAFTVPSIGGSYEARWNSATNAWEGSWLQAGQRWQLALSASTRPQRTAPKPLAGDWQIPADDAISRIVETRLAGRSGAVMVVGVIEPHGTRIVARGPVASDTLFEIGSITKIFTALLLAEAARRGEVALDDRVLTHLPQGTAMPQGGGEEITLRQLSQHRSGLPRLPENMPFGDPADPYSDYTDAHLYDFLRRHTLTRLPGSAFEYSNLGVGLLGHILARAAGMDYEQLVRSRILEPLGMAVSGITLTDEQRATMAQGHDEFMRPASEWHFLELAGAGALRSTPDDMLRFVESVIDPASSIAPALAITLDGWQPMAGEVTGLGWMGFQPPQGPVMFHGGGTGGFRSAIAVQPQAGRGVVVLTNAAVEPSAEDIAFHLIAGTPLSPASPVAPPPPPPAAREEVALTREQLAHVTGRYRIAAGVEGEVRLGERGLTAQITGQPALPIFASARLEFFWRAVDAQIRFIESDGRVIGAMLHQGGQDVPLERIGD